MTNLTAKLAHTPPFPTLYTARLRLEPVDDAHLEGMFRLNSDPAVMRYITGKPDTREDTLAMIERTKARWVESGFSWWSFFEGDDLIGIGCIQHMERNPNNPVELAWRIRQDKWRQGFALEAAQRMVQFAFETVGLAALVAVCHQENVGSARVMQRLGMQYLETRQWYGMDAFVYQLAKDVWVAQINQAKCPHATRQ